MACGDGTTASSRTRALLDAAANGDVVAVETWIAQRDDAPDSDVNATRGEGWTALLYAVSKSHVAVTAQLVTQRGIDLNATTITGSSALEMALKRQHNAMIRLLLTHGASRSTISDAHLAVAMASSWIQSDVKTMLSPQWSVVWSPELHAHFSADQREKCRLVVMANALAARKLTQSFSVWSLLLGWGRWWLRILAAVFFGSSATLVENASSKRDARCGTSHVRWAHLPAPLVERILEFAMYLW
uniref:Uncharacterized protein n=1 Tax=Globisporangium ultimum (strain ATCC 200006 / CBS 805.95 / DAOM BR144) TaxID=431595 RepID=K3WTX2_GLOUD